MENITIKDIAKALNISTSTVSRALRDSYEINTETKRLVLEYAERMNYRPNPIALSLKENKSKAIGVVVPEIANNFFANTINGIEDIAFDRGYHVTIYQTHEDASRERVHIEHVVSRKMDGLLISMIGDKSNLSVFEELAKKNFPMVFFDRVPSFVAHKVVADNFNGAFQATEHLLLSGKKRIAHVASQSTSSVSHERIAGYKAALEKYNIPFDESLIHYCGTDSQEAFETISEIIATKQPDAIFTGSDRLALQSYEVLRKLNIKVPEELAYIGFTNLSVANLLSPPLTTVVQPSFEMGQMAAKMLLDLIEQKKPIEVFETKKLSTELCIRESSK